MTVIIVTAVNAEANCVQWPLSKADRLYLRGAEGAYFGQCKWPCPPQQTAQSHPLIGPLGEFSWFMRSNPTAFMQLENLTDSKPESRRLQILFYDILVDQLNIRKPRIIPTPCSCSQ